MARLLLNYLVVTLLLISFLGTVFVGLMLAFVIPEQEHVLWGVGHRAWTYLHLFAALTFTAFVAMHVALHSTWLKNTSSRFVPRSVAAWSAIVLLIASGAIYLGLGAARSSSAHLMKVSFGREVYLVHNCDACHSIAGVGGLSGPDLTHVGSERSRAWLRVEITNPAAHTPRSRMPAFPLAEKQLDALMHYLASLK
jgi:mono/diheme cytochrome c family protein